VDAALVEEMAGRIDLSRSALDLAAGRQAKAALTSLTGVNRDSAETLRRAGFTNVGALAGAGVETVARALGGDTARATQIVNAAQGKVGMMR
jgi:predicted RecB family nuclease